MIVVDINMPLWSGGDGVFSPCSSLSQHSSHENSLVGTADEFEDEFDTTHLPTTGGKV